jgi:hypothetical protein
MKLDDKVTVYCTNNDASAEASIVNITKDSIRVLLNGIPIWLNRTKPGVYVGSEHGMEFIVKTANSN